MMSHTAIPIPVVRYNKIIDLYGICRSIRGNGGEMAIWYYLQVFLKLVVYLCLHGRLLAVQLYQMKNC